MTLKGNLKTNLAKVEKGYISDLENIIFDMISNFNIYQQNGNGEDDIKITKDDLINLYITPLIQKEKQYQCSAILINGNRCSHKSLKETRYKYCKKHFFKDQQKYNSDKRMNTVEEQDEVSNEVDNNSKIFIMKSNHVTQTYSEHINKETLKKHFIDDKLYYIDDKYIYDENYSKSGYIEKEISSDETNYILINDPFILQNI